MKMWRKALRNGGLKFVLRGKKMKGKWTLVRMGGKFRRCEEAELAVDQRA